MNIDDRAVVSPDADLADDVVVGPFSIIENDTVIGAGTKIESNVVIASGSRIGKNCHIFHSAVIGTAPQDLKYKGEKTRVEIGDNNVIREFCTINRGTTASEKTVVGSGCLIMTYTHIAHDCVIGNNVILSNAVNMAGHVAIDDWAIIGGMVPIHQFTRVGKHAFVGGGLRVDRDVPPYILAAGDPLGYKGLNSVGLRRRNFSQELRNKIKSVYKAIYLQNTNVTQALEYLKSDEESDPHILEIYTFIKSSKRGIISGMK